MRSGERVFRLSGIEAPLFASKDVCSWCSRYLRDKSFVSRVMHKVELVLLPAAQEANLTDKVQALPITHFISGDSKYPANQNLLTFFCVSCHLWVPRSPN